jgi:hypothetical protein
MADDQTLPETLFELIPKDLGLEDLLGCDLPETSTCRSESVDRIHTFIDKQNKENTVKSTKRDIKIFTEYLFGQGEFLLIENIP